MFVSFSSSQPYGSGRTAKILYPFNRDRLYSKFDFKILFRIPKACKHLLIFEIMSFSYDILHVICVKVCLQVMVLS
jgi:hypothetical protein